MMPEILVSGVSWSFVGSEVGQISSSKKHRKPGLFMRRVYSRPQGKPTWNFLESPFNLNKLLRKNPSIQPPSSGDFLKHPCTSSENSPNSCLGKSARFSINFQWDLIKQVGKFARISIIISRRKHRTMHFSWHLQDKQITILGLSLFIRFGTFILYLGSDLRSLS